MLRKAILYTLFIWAVTMIGITVWALLITDDMVDFTWDRFTVTTLAQFIVGVPTFYYIGRLVQKKKQKQND